MNPRVTAAVAAGALAIGALAGAAGTIVLGNAGAVSTLDRHHPQVGPMMQMMGTPMMDGGQMGPGSALHEAHHPRVDR